MSTVKACLFCGEDIATDADVCHHCGERQKLERIRPSIGDWRLKTAAVLQLCLGALAGIFAPCALLGVIMQASMPQLQQQAQGQLGAQLMGIGIYVVIAIFFISTGYAAWKGQRWVRPIMLALMAPSLILGACATVAGMYMAPVMMEMTQRMLEQMPQGQAPPPGMGNITSIMLVITGIFMFVIYVGIPGVFTALYWSPRIKEVCEKLDRTPRWTDGRPLPMVALIVWLALFALGSIMFPAYGAAPAFGILLTGWQPYAFAAVFFAVCVGLCYATYKTHPAGWWGSVAMVLLMGVSSTLTFLRVDMMDVYRAMKTPQQQLDILQEIDLSPMRHVGMGTGVVMLLVGLAFLLYVRRFFFEAPAEPSAAEPPAGPPPAEPPASEPPAPA